VIETRQGGFTTSADPNADAEQQSLVTSNGGLVSTVGTHALTSIHMTTGWFGPASIDFEWELVTEVLYTLPDNSTRNSKVVGYSFYDTIDFDVMLATGKTLTFVGGSAGLVDGFQVDRPASPANVTTLSGEVQFVSSVSQLRLARGSPDTVPPDVKKLCRSDQECELACKMANWKTDAQCQTEIATQARRQIPTASSGRRALTASACADPSSCISAAISCIKQGDMCACTQTEAQCWQAHGCPLDEFEAQCHAHTGCPCKP